MQAQLNTLLQAILPVNLTLAKAAKAHLDNLTKPQGSLGQLEDLATKLYCIQQGQQLLQVDPMHMFTVAGDHGIFAENVSAHPQAVTRQMVANFLHGGAGINVLCKTNALDLCVVDAGCVGGPFAAHEKLIDKRLGEGTANFAKGPAMTRNTCIQALLQGASIALDAAQKGYKTIGIGEMGIGNTTPATALFCAYLGLDPQKITGPGAGISAAGIIHKANIITKALELHKNALENGDAIDTLALVGGFEIATMAGIVLGAAKAGCLVLVDGFISTSAYAAAKHICENIQHYCVLCHSSAEPGYASVIQALHEDTPLLDLHLRLGEGTGAALAAPIVRSAAAIFNNMATFDQANVCGQTIN